MIGTIISLGSLFAVTCAKRVTCVGDSITSGGACLEESYVNDLQNMLGSSYQVMNAGKSGCTMLKGGVLDSSAEPYSCWDGDEYKAALESKPDIVTIMLGTNDAKYYNWEGVQQNTGDYFALDYVISCVHFDFFLIFVKVDMVKSFRQLDPVPEVYLLVPPPLYEPYPYDMNATIINSIYSTLIRNIGDVVGAEVVDVFTAFKTSGLTAAELSCDGCHPTADGNKVIATAIATKIRHKAE
jgi:acyl-CoA thioesterase I